MANKISILIAFTDQSVADHWKLILENLGHKVLLANSLAQISEITEIESIDLLLLDARFPDLNTEDYHSMFDQNRINLSKMILFSDSDTVWVKQNKDWINTFDEYVQLPISDEELVSHIRLIQRLREVEHFSNGSQSAFDQLPLGYVVLDEEGIISGANRVLQNLLGYTLKEMMGRMFGEFLAEADQKLFRHLLPKIIEKKEVHGIEFDALRKDGVNISLSFDTSVINDPLTGHNQLHCILGDSTKRKLARIQVKDLLTEAQYIRDTLDLVPCCIYSKDLDSRYQSANKMTRDLFGCSEKEIIGSSDSKFFPSDTVKKLQEIDAKVMGGVQNIETLEISDSKNNRHVFLEVKTPIINKNEENKIVGLLGISSEITQRIEAEEALKKSEGKYRSLVEEVPAIVFLLPFLESDIAPYISPFVEQLLGYCPEELLKESKWCDVIHPDDLPLLLNLSSRMHKNEGKGQVDFRVFTKDGRQLWMQATSWAVCNEAGQPLYFQGIAIDITERHQAVEALRESQRRLMTLMGNLPGMAYRCKKDKQWTMEFVSEGCQMLTGYFPEDLVENKRLSYSQLVHPEDIQMVREMIEGLVAQEKSFNLIYRIHTASGEEKWVEEKGQGVFGPKGNLIALEGFICDITEKENARKTLLDYSNKLKIEVNERTKELGITQEKLIRNERMAVLGQFAGNVGHELRNPLGVIANSVYYLRMIQPDAEPKVKEYLDRIDKEINNSEAIINNLLGFAKIKLMNKLLVSAEELITNSIHHHPIPEKVMVNVSISPELPDLYVDPYHIEQALVNLIINAYQEMPQGGDLAISGTLVSQNGDNYVAIIVKDTGGGISKENFDRVFEPLFTTKAKGIGLGLSICRYLIEANSGTIEVKSEPGQGAEFIVLLPCLKN